MSGPICSVEDCYRTDIRARGMCVAHYQRWYSRGYRQSAREVFLDLKVMSRTGDCAVAGCEAPIQARGFCCNHYERYLRGDRGERLARPIRRQNHERGCSVAGCDREHSARGFCNLHHKRWLKHGEPGPPGVMRRSAGTGALTSDGYIMVRDGRAVGRRRVAQHRLIMENVVGRRLHAWETVHHKNGIRSDNQPENLELWIKGHPAGQRLHDLIEFVLTNYPEEVAMHQLRAATRAA